MGLSLPGNGSGAATASSLTIPTVGSISVWIRPQSLGGTQRICATADDFEARFSGTTLYNDWGMSGATSLTFGTFSNGTLVHLTATWNVTSGAGEAFRDGASVGTDSTRNGVTNGTFTLGARGTLNPFNGELFDVRLYNRILSAAEVQTIYNARGRDGIVHGLIHRWTMDESPPGTSLSGTGTVKDQGPNQVNISVGTGTAPTYVYAGDLHSRRRTI